MPDLPDTAFGLAHFLEQTDAVGFSAFALLILMSLLSWYRIAVKAYRHGLIRARSCAYLSAFRAARRDLWRGLPGDTPFARVLDEGLAACRLLQEGERGEGGKGGERAFALAAPDDFVAAALQRAVAEEGRRLDEGLTTLASVASSAPFVGLFGTVWGIYHALLSIGASGQASLDQVAGPVGEALVMTACGLFVAIPAVLAYNAFTRMNRNLVGELESHAHDVFSLLGLGRFVSPDAAGFPESARFTPSLARPAAGGAST
jgi:biopolymer transport protein ExbB